MISRGKSRVKAAVQINYLATPLAKSKFPSVAMGGRDSSQPKRERKKEKRRRGKSRHGKSETAKNGV